jgi:hypothetical protein
VTCVPDTPHERDCSYTITPSSQHFPYRGGIGNVVVTTRGGCPWTAASNVPWIIVTSAGGGSASYNVLENMDAARTGTLAVAGQTLTVTQDAAPVAPRPPQPPQPSPPPSCTYAVQETPQTFTYQGGSGGFSVSASRSNCTWTAVAQVPWIAVTGGSPGSGNGSVSYMVAGNAGPARTGTIAVAGKTVTIRQSAP